MTQEEIASMFGDPVFQAQMKNALSSGATNATGQTGANASNQVQGSTQSGDFASSGTSSQTGNTSQSQNQVGNQVGTTNQQQSGQTGVVDTLGMGSMLQGQQGDAAARDSASTGFLTGVLKDGDPALQSKVQQAVNNATSGPGMVGAGQSANARAAGYAGAEVGRQAQAQQLQASSLLSGPTATTTLANASNPYLGQTSTQNMNGVQKQDSSTSSLGDTLSSVIENQNQTGQSNASSAQVAAGTSPVQKQEKGGSIICTVMVKRGWLRRSVVVAELAHIRMNWDQFRRAAIGYYFFGQKVAKWCLRSVIVSALCWPLVWACTNEAMRRMFWKKGLNPFAWLGYKFFFFFCDKLGLLLLTFWPQHAQDKVTDPELVTLLKRFDLEL